MAALSTTDMKLIDSIFGMYSGNVLDFSIPRFGSFFQRDLGIDIFHDRYAIHGGSKGKMFRGFLEVASNADAARALHALWEYRETYRLDQNEKDTVLNSRTRLSAVVVKLGGKPLPAGFDEPVPASARRHRCSRGPALKSWPGSNPNSWR
ncbi:MAG: hypothetical protein ABIY37_01875 [Devosia sp.]